MIIQLLFRFTDTRARWWKNENIFAEFRQKDIGNYDELLYTSHFNSLLITQRSVLIFIFFSQAQLAVIMLH